jgi:tricarballylate dehydrogenase
MQRFKGSWVYDTTDKPPEKADTIEELATKLGLKPEELKKSVDEYNAAVDDTTTFDLMKLDGKATHGLKVNKTNWAQKIEKGPFYGYPMTANLTFTYVAEELARQCQPEQNADAANRYGGVKTDLEARVLSTNDVPIPGLWGAGEMTGLYYNEYPPATSCLRSMTFGRLAGASIAKNLGKPLVVGR